MEIEAPRRTLPQQRAAQTRQRILTAAARVFARRGYRQATMDDLAFEAGVSKGALYHHFAAKEELFRAMLSDHTAAAQELRQAMAQGAAFRDLLDGTVAFWIAHYRTNPDFIPLSLECRVQAVREPWSKQALGGYYDRIRGEIVAMLRLGQEQGAISADLDLRQAAVLVFGLLDGVCLQWGIDPERVDLDALERTLADALARILT